jgi:hypothetical protein
MATLPITRMILFKHGVGYFERRGTYSGERLELRFPLEAMDDLLKSLIAIDLGAGQVLGVDFETPEDRAARLERGSIHLSDEHSMLDLFRDLRGRQVRLSLTAPEQSTLQLEGLMVGIDYESPQALHDATVTLYLPESRQVRSVPLSQLVHVELLDAGAVADLTYFLRAAQSEEQQRSATLRMSAGEHDLLVGYVTPAPAWRVSYRLLFESEGEANVVATESQPTSSVLLQGWGIFDNQLEEDLEGVELTLMAGMPVSFRYRLYEPNTPERPLVGDEARVVQGPIAFAAAPPLAAAGELAMMAPPDEPGYDRGTTTRKLRMRATAVEQTVQAAAGGDERGALFAYRVVHPVSVARGQSAMVPIVSQRLSARRELLYASDKLPRHPVATLRLKNDTGLTLERGPVTVLDSGDYAGEAVIPFTRAGGELLISFAVELGIRIEEQRDTKRQLVALRLRNDYLIFEERDLVISNYQLSSGLDRPVEVVVEHRCLSGYDLVSPTDPDEQSSSFARWRVACPPQARHLFQVTEQRLLSRQERVRSLDGTQLQAFLRDRLLTAATIQGLQGVLGLYKQIDTAQAQIERLERDREAIYKQQRQIQGSLTPLTREGDEGALRQRYVATLGQIEDQLAAMLSEQEHLKTQIAQLNEQIAQQLKQLSSKA